VAIVFDCHLVITPWLCFCQVFVVGAKRKRKRREEKKEDV
jgi:hypothetical protein